MDFDQRDEDKTSANILILGNSGQGKSYLMKLLILNLLESGKSIITLDAEHEQQEMCEAVGGCFADLMAGKYIINVLERSVGMTAVTPKIRSHRKPSEKAPCWRSTFPSSRTSSAPTRIFRCPYRHH